MPDINVAHSLPLPPVTASTVMLQALDAIKTLRVELRDLGLPDVGYVAVPVVVESGAPKPEARGPCPLTIRAERHADAFPVFHGEIGTDPAGPSSSTLWIGGSYTPPLAHAGALIDAALLSRVAQHALENFLAELADEVTRRGRAHEINDVRAHRMD